LKGDCQRFAEQRSFRFNLAYAEGFEAMALLVEDGLWYRPSSRLAVYGVLIRIFRRLLPRLLRVLRPGYDPREVPDPEWAIRWRQLHDGGETGLGQLDTRQIDAHSPKVMPA
jgi:hypothetical protein